MPDAPTPDHYTPRQTLAGEAWRLVPMVAFSAIAWNEGVGREWDHARWLFWVDLLGGLACFPLVWTRRRAPFRTAVVIALIGIFSAVSTGPNALAIMSLATRRRLPQIVIVGVLTVAASQVYAYLVPGLNKGYEAVSLGTTVAVTAAFLAGGMYIGSRRELMWSLRQRAIAAEERQEMRLDQARAQERERIAREMHDVLAHRISLVSMHAGALAFRTDLSPDQVRETARLIQTTSHDALTDLRQVLGVLRGSQGEVRPQPTLDELATLVDEASGIDVNVDLVVDLPAQPPVPQNIGRTAYRIIQEGLTNARKHATGTRVSVHVAGSPGQGLMVRLRNPLRVGSWERAPGSGLGLVGLRERAELAGGTLETRQDDREFVLEGRLPWPE